jgi:hypothetical protein
MTASMPPSFAARIQLNIGSPAFRTLRLWTRMPTRSSRPWLVSKAWWLEFVVRDLMKHSEPAAQPPVVTEPIHRAKVTKAHIRRPRNQFIIYRQWMSAKIHASKPGLTAGCICKFSPHLPP